MLPFIKLYDIKIVSEKVPESVFFFLLTLAVLVLGTVYYAINIRDLLWRRFVKQCHKNIRARMVYPFRGHSEQLTDQEMMRIFYNIIDNDCSLRDQQNDVRLNGAVLTTIIDTILILFFFTIVYFVALLITNLQVFILSIAISVSLQPLLWFLKRRVSNKHIRFENEQLGVIEQLHSDRVRALLQNRGRVNIY